VAFVQEFDSEALVLGARHKFTVVVVNVEVLAGVDKSEELHTLHNCVNTVFNVKNARTCPVLRLHIVNVGLSGRADNHEAELH